MAKKKFEHEGNRSLFWGESQRTSLDLPWRLFLKEEASWFPAQWRLFHELKSAEEEEKVDAMAFVGETINNYRIEELLGEGSLGTVYRAIHINLNEERAIKITHRAIEGYDLLKEILFAGNKGLGSIRHPNVVNFYDVGEIVLYGQKRMYIVMELVKGQRLDKIDRGLITQNGEQITDLAVQICAGLEAAHKTKFTDAGGMPREGIIHGNLNSRKILFTSKGKPKIIDFMFADISRSSLIRLDVPETVQNKQRAERLADFLPPEVLSGEQNVDRQTDIFSVGAIFFHVYSGKPIADFDFQTADSLHRFIKETTKYIPKNLSKAIFKATRPNPQQRYQNVGDMISDMLENTSVWKKIIYWFKRK